MKAVTQLCTTLGTRCGYFQRERGHDERLRLLLQAWAELHGSVKDAVLEMVRGYSSSGS